MALAAIRDITDRRRDRDELRRAVRRLQAATDVAIAVGRRDRPRARARGDRGARPRAGRGPGADHPAAGGGRARGRGATAAVAGGLDPDGRRSQDSRAWRPRSGCCSAGSPARTSAAKESGRALIAPASLPRRPARRGRRPRPGRRPGPLRRRAPAAAGGLRGQRRDGRRDRAVDGRGAAAEHDRRRGAGAEPLGSRAARRDAAGSGRAPHAALVGAAGGDRRGRCTRPAGRPSSRSTRRS